MASLTSFGKINLNSVLSLFFFACNAFVYEGLQVHWMVIFAKSLALPLITLELVALYAMVLYNACWHSVSKKALYGFEKKNIFLGIRNNVWQAAKNGRHFVPRHTGTRRCDFLQPENLRRQIGSFEITNHRAKREIANGQRIFQSSRESWKFSQRFESVRISPTIFQMKWIS